MTTFAASAKTSSSPLQLFTMFPPAGGTPGMKGFSGAFSAMSDTVDQTSMAPPSEPPIPPARPSRHQHVQHAAQWTETKTLGPGLVMHSTTATVSQWSEFQQSTEISRSQFQTIRTQTVQSSSSSGVLTPAQYLDDLQLDAQQLDVGAQLVKSSMGRKGSLGGRRPPTVKMRRSSHLLVLEQPLDIQQTAEPTRDPTPEPTPEANSRPWTNQQTFDIEPPTPKPPPALIQKESCAKNGPTKIPPPRPPPPVFNRPPPPAEPQPASSEDWSRSATPPSLPPNSPPPLPVKDELDFVLEKTPSESSTSETTSVLSPRHSVMTDVVEINDKESIDDEGEVVRRRTIITLGQKMVSGGSSGSINVTLLNSPAEVKNDPEDESPRPVCRASAFNARRTIELRRQQQHLDNNPIQCQVDEPKPEPEPEQPLSKTPSSTYLFGERGSPASSFGGSSLRTVSISMSFDDLESNASEKKSPGRNRSEAWYERRQSYGFEAADKLQSLLNTSGSSDVPSTGAISRSCDSLSSTVRSTSSQIEKMIPPWLKSPARPSEEEEVKVESRISYFGESMEDVISTSKRRMPDDKDGRDTSPPPVTPTPSIQRSESSRSASNLTETEPAWLRDLKMRRSLRDNRRTPPVRQDPNPETPVWLNVKLRPTGLNLVDSDPAEEQSKPSPTKPSLTPIFTFVNTKQSSKVQQHLRNSLENILDNNNIDSTKSNELIDQVKENNNNNQVKKSSSVVIVNSSRESLHSDSGSVKSAPIESALSNRLNHHRSIELMRMLEETPLVTANGVNYERTTDESGSVFTDAASVYSMGDESFASVRNSSEDLAGTQAKKKRVAFGADVKEESDRGRSRPRRIRSRSPETRLRQWQEKLEEVKSVHSEVTTTTVTSDSKPLRHFGDDEKPPETISNSVVSDTFKSLLQPRSPYVIEPVKESVVIDSYPLMRASSGPADVMRTVRNGIVNFDSSVERKIVILETENAPAPKSILKKRSLENLLEPTNPPVVANLLPLTVTNPPLIATTITPAIHSGIKVSITNQKKEPVVVVEQQVRPWRIHLKHVDPPLRIKSPDREATPEPWKADITRKKTPPFKSPEREIPLSSNSKIAPRIKSPEREVITPANLRKTPALRSGTPENFFRGRSPSSASDSSSIPGMQAAELIRNLRNTRQQPVMMVARCEVKESAFKQPIEPASTKADHGYHSLEPDAECGSAKRSEFKAIDETIAKLNETIEEIRSVNVILTNDNSNPLVIREAPEAGKNENRFFVREIRPSRSASKVHPIVDGHIPTITPIRIREPTRSASLGSQPPVNSSSYPLRRHSSGTCTPSPPPSEPVRKFSSGTNRSSTGLHISGIQPAQPTKVSESKSSTVKSTYFQSTAFKTAQSRAARPEEAKSAPAGATPLRSRRSASSRSPSPVSGRPSDKLARVTSARIVTGPGSDRESDVQPEKASGSEEALHHVKDLVQTFEISRPERSKSSAECCRKMSTESLRSVSSVSSVSSCGRLRSTIQSMQKPFSSAPSSPLVGNKQPANKEKPVELTSGMPEDKAAIIIRKYFGTSSVIETTKSRMAETIHEEASDISSTITEDKRVMKITEAFDSEDFFNVESGTELMSSSSFGSALDNLESTDDDRASVTTVSSSKASSTTVTSMRYSSCSERSVKLSDIINRPEKSSNNVDHVSTSTSVASGSVRSAVSRKSSTTSTSSTSTFDNRNGSVRRNKPRRHPTVIKKDKGNIKEAPKSPKAPARARASVSTTKADNQAPTVTAPPRRLSSKKANAKPEVSPSTTTPPVRPLRPIQPPLPAKKSRSSTTTTNRAAVILSAKAPSASAKTPSSARAANDKKPSSTSNGVHATTKSNKLVTITSYNSRGIATKHDEAVSGIKVTPVAVGSGHYKIRMEQRLSATATSTGGQKVTSSSQRTQKITTATSAGKRTVTTSTSSRKT